LGCSWGCLYGAGIWTSPDGQTWTAALREPSTPTTYEMLGGVVTGPAGLLAHAQHGASLETTILWTSPDGGTWTEVHPTGLDGIALNGIVATADGYLGVAAVRVPGPTIFRSPDGVHWTPAAPRGPSLGGIIAVDDGFVAWNNVAFDTSAFVTASYGVRTPPLTDLARRGDLAARGRIRWVLLGDDVGGRPDADLDRLEQ